MCDTSQHDHWRIEGSGGGEERGKKRRGTMWKERGPFFCHRVLAWNSKRRHFDIELLTRGDEKRRLTSSTSHRTGDREWRNSAHWAPICPRVLAAGSHALPRRRIPTKWRLVYFAWCRNSPCYDSRLCSLAAPCSRSRWVSWSTWVSLMQRRKTTTMTSLYSWCSPGSSSAAYCRDRIGNTPHTQVRRVNVCKRRNARQSSSHLDALWPNIICTRVAFPYYH